VAERLSEMKRDVLTEIANIAFGHASTLFSQKTSKEVKLMCPLKINY